MTLPRALQRAVAYCAIALTALQPAMVLAQQQQYQYYKYVPRLVVTGSPIVVPPTGGPAGKLTLSANALAFSSLNVGANESQSVVLTNSGNASLSLSSVSVATGSAPAFSSSSTCGTALAAGATCAVTAIFAPTTSGVFSGSLTVNGESIALGGTGLQGNASLSASSLTFDTQDINTSSAPQTLVVTNSGTAPLNVSGIAVDQGIAHFGASNDCGSTLAINGTCQVSVVFSPKSNGELSGRILIANNGSSGAGVVTFTGNGSLLSPQLRNFSIPTKAYGSGPFTIPGPSSNSSGQIRYASSNPAVATVSPDTQHCEYGACISTFGNVLSIVGEGSTTITATQFGAGNYNGGTISTTFTVTPGQGNASLSKDSLTFSNQVLTTTSAAQTVTVTNSGSAPLTIGGIQIDQGTGVFTQSNSCGAVLPVNGTCLISVAFTPVVSGVTTGSVIIASDGANGPQTITFSGTGVAGVLSQPTSVAFGNVNVGTSGQQTVVVSNSGSGSLATTVPTAASITTNSEEFSFVSTTCSTSLAASATCNVVVQLTPTASGTRFGVLTLNGQAVSLGGTGTLAVLSLPASVTFGNTVVANFGTTNVDTFSLQMIVVSNSGNEVLALTPPNAASITTNPTEFSFVSTTCSTTVAAGSNCSVVVKFSPTVGGTRSGVFTLSGQTVPLSGFGLQGNANISVSSLVFGNQNMATSSAAQAITVTNNGFHSLYFTGISVDQGGAAFGQSNNCGTELNPNASCQISVMFTPTVSGPLTGRVLIGNVGTSGSGTVTFTGTGTQGILSQPTSISFGNATLSDYSQQTVTMSNTGTGPLAVTVPSAASITANSAEFSFVSTTCTATLAASSSCNIVLRMTPSASGTRSGVLTLNGSAVPLSGTGVVIAPNTSFGSVDIGSSVNRVITVTNSSNQTLAFTVPSAASITTNSAEFAFISTTCSGSLAPTATCTVSVRMTPSVGGARAGVLTVNGQAVSLSGTGNAVPVSATFVGSTVADVMNGNLVVNKPAGTAPGDLMLMFFTSAGPISAPPPGWAQVTGFYWPTYGYPTYAYSKIAGAAEPASYTVGNTSVEITGAILTYRGATAVDTVGTYAHSLGVYSLPSVNTTIANQTVIGVAFDRSPTVPIKPAGQINRAGILGTYLGLRVADESYATIGATGTRAFTGGSVYKGVGFLLTIR